MTPPAPSSTAAQWQGRAGQGRAGQGRAGQGNGGQGRAGQGRTMEGGTVQGSAEQDRTGMVRQGSAVQAGQGKVLDRLPKDELHRFIALHSLMLNGHASRPCMQ